MKTLFKSIAVALTLSAIMPLCEPLSHAAEAPVLPTEPDSSAEIILAENEDASDAVQPAAENTAETTEEEASAIANEEQSPLAASDAEDAVPNDTRYTSSSLDFHIVVGYKKYVVDSFVKIEVYDKNNNLVGTEREWVGGITRTLDLHYDVPEYTLGDAFTVKLVEGAVSLAYYDTTIKPGESLTVTTNYYTDSNGEFVSGNVFNFDMVPNWEKEVIVYCEDKKLSLNPRARIVNSKTLVPVRRVAEAMGLNVKYDSRYDSVVCSVGDQQLIFNMGNTYTTLNNDSFNIDVAPCYIQKSAYVPVRTLAEAFNAPLSVTDHGDNLEIVIGQSEKVREYLLKTPVNRWNISSRTDYMVWVSKSEYTVRLYEGSKNNWKLIYTAPCAIGAPDTPTITGSYEYIEKTRWDYPGYYVGPVLRFHNGYALHSTLLYYNGTEYDGRVGVQISHGCIRLHPKDINYIASTVPMYTRIYITE